MRSLDESDIYPTVSAFLGEAGWTERLDAEDSEELADVLRSTLHEGYASASDDEMEDALANVLDSLSPAEAFNFGSALNQIGKSASRVVSDPTFVSVARTALPVLGGATGTLIGGPVGTALGGKLGSLAASALPARPTPAPVTAQPTVAASSPGIRASAPQPVVAAPAPSAAAAAPPGVAPRPGLASPAAGGSAAAAQGLVLTQQPDVLRSLLATALGQHGRQAVSGVPVAQVLGLLSQVFGKAAADADELMYLGQQPDSAESVLDAADDSADLLYADLLGADNLELSEATGWDWRDR
jgi:hypothetical protein